jgi:quercetin dioxygenase-like cupin family protein
MTTSTKSPAEASSPLIRQADLPGPAGARTFVGSQHGLPVSMFLVDSQPGAGPLLHRHPYPELFIVHDGTAEFDIDGVRTIATAGDMLIAPAGSAHRFTNIGDARLRVTAIHTAADMSTEWLEPC